MFYHCSFECTQGPEISVSLSMTILTMMQSMNITHLEFDPTFFDTTWNPMFLLCLSYAAHCIIHQSGTNSTKTEKRSQWITKAQCGFNGFMWIYSILICILSWPTLFYDQTNESIHTLHCGLGTMFYLMSKPLELGDTMFLILLGKPLLTLHWCHHVLTFIFTWLCGVYGSYSGVLMGHLNAHVHAVMYGYFTLVWFFPCIQKYSKWITAIQIAQFVIVLVLFPWYAYDLPWMLVFYTLGMYLYYLIAFSLLYRQKRAIKLAKLCAHCKSDYAVFPCVICHANTCSQCRINGYCKLCEEMKNH